MIKEKFKLDFDFNLSYKDPDFDGQLCSLVDLEELPQKAVVKAVRCEIDASSVASDDTIILPHAVTPTGLRDGRMFFQCPLFLTRYNSYLVREMLHVRKQGRLKLSRGQKHDILETLAAK